MLRRSAEIAHIPSDLIFQARAWASSRFKESRRRALGRRKDEDASARQPILQRLEKKEQGKGRQFGVGEQGSQREERLSGYEEWTAIRGYTQPQKNSWQSQHFIQLVKLKSCLVRVWYFGLSHVTLVTSNKTCEQMAFILTGLKFSLGSRKSVSWDYSWPLALVRCFLVIWEGRTLNFFILIWRLTYSPTEGRLKSTGR